MATEEIPSKLAALAEKMASEYRDSEYEIALALAAAEGPLTTEELAEETGYTERTVKKRVGTLEEELGGEPLLQRDEEDRPVLHPALAEAVRAQASA
ncbi:winged helix-turn-helix transcriptional regulator [Halalkalicoccus subterraneus]|uniref:winged helix-turn-helix transcriptional regulator n=1 Tax=Halalkalicoccus subterraneus TaxID=2675002 RepID=UPI000EFBF517|nr:HTH domain-containing protein [Halalkalicoccus subterraneus]